MAGQLVGNILNILLDPVLILSLGWGAAGAALATSISNVAGAVFYIQYLYSGKSMLTPSLLYFTWKENILQNVLSIGIPASLGDMAVAGFGVSMKITMITGMICIGFGQGVQPLFGYCIGAGKGTRFQKSLFYSACSAFMMSTMMTIFCYCFIDYLVSAFLTDTTAYEYALHFAEILLSTSFFFGLYYVFLNALQAMGEAGRALIINLSRQGIIYLPVLFYLDHRFGISGLLWAQPVADVLSLVLVILLYRSAWKQWRKRRI